jgi:hypothetical protein
MKRNTLLALVGAASLALGANAVAAPTTYTNFADFANEWNYSAVTGDGNAISGKVYWEIFDNTFYFGLLNTSPFNARLTAFGFDFPEDVSYSGDFSGPSGWVLEQPGNLPGLSFDACAVDGGNCIAPQGQTGFTPNNAFNLFSVGLIGSADFDAWNAVRSCLRFGTVGPDGEDSGVACREPDFDFDVPEPSSLALLGLGLIGVGLARRRKLLA